MPANCFITQATSERGDDARHVQHEQHQSLQVERPDLACAGMNAAISSAYTGRRAEQVMSGAIMMVVRRSRQLGMVRVAMMPGIAHARLDSSGMNARPDRPTQPISRSSR